MTCSKVFFMFQVEPEQPSQPPSKSPDARETVKFLIISPPSPTPPAAVKCIVCNKILKDSKILRDHYKRVHQKLQRHFCKECNKGFFNKTDLRVHQQSHLETKEHVCDVCQKSFSAIGALNRHKKEIHTKLEFACPLCDKIFKNERGIKEHYKRCPRISHR